MKIHSVYQDSKNISCKLDRNGKNAASHHCIIQVNRKGRYAQLQKLMGSTSYRTEKLGWNRKETGVIQKFISWGKKGPKVGMQFPLPSFLVFPKCCRLPLGTRRMAEAGFDEGDCQ